MTVTTRVFATYLDWISDHYQVIPLADLVRLRQHPITGGKPFCALTFDDGWRDNFLHAFPILRERRLPATVFLCVRFVNTDRRFWQERLWIGLRAFGSKKELREAADRVVRSLPWCRRITPDLLTFNYLRRFLLERPSTEAEEFVDQLIPEAGRPEGSDAPAFLSWDEIRAMQQGGVTFGSHTLNHTLLSRADPATAWREIQDSRQELAEHLGSPPESIAYPWGGMGPHTLGQVKAAGYEAGLTTTAGLIDGSSDRLLLPRLLISSSSVCAIKKGFHAGKASLLMARSALASRSDGGWPAGTGKWRRERIRVGLVIDSIDTWEGGTEQQLVKLIAALDHTYFEPELYFLRPSLGLKPNDFPCPLHLAGSLREVKWYRPEAFKHLVRLFRDRRPHIVQTFFRDATYYGIIAAKIARVPITVVSKRNAVQSERCRDRLFLIVIKRLAKRWQCNSRAVAEALESEAHIQAEHIDVLPNAVDLSRFAPATPQERLTARQQLGLPPEAPVFVAVANLRPVKDLSTLVTAAHLVQQELPTAHFLLAGEGPLRDSLKAQAASLRLGQCMRFMGPMADVRAYLAAADIGLLTSLSEASSNSVLEYMAMGLPVLASNIPANRELVDEVLFTTGDATDLADKAVRLWGNAEGRARMSRENRQRAMQHALETLAPRVQSYYIKLASEYL